MNQKLVQINKDINRIKSKLQWIKHREKILPQQKECNKLHRKEINMRRKEQYKNDEKARMNKIIDVKFHQTKRNVLRGLCHVCCCSNKEIYLKDGRILCDDCIERYNE